MALSAVAARKQKSQEQVDATMVTPEEDTSRKKRKRYSDMEGRAFSPSDPVDLDGSGVLVSDIHHPIIKFLLDEVEIISISPSLVETKGTVLVLRPGEEVTMVGVAITTVLSGALSVLGATLQPSFIPHRIFAPRSHPLPVFKAVAYLQSPQDPHFILPRTISHCMTEGCTVVLIQPVATGIQDLQKICPIFDGIFEGSASWDYEEFHLLVSKNSSRILKPLSKFHIRQAWIRQMRQGSIPRSLGMMRSPLSPLLLMISILSLRKCKARSAQGRVRLRGRW